MKKLIIILLLFSACDEKPKEKPKPEGKLFLRSPEGCTIYKLIDKEESPYPIYLCICPDSVNVALTKGAY